MKNLLFLLLFLQLHPCFSQKQLVLCEYFSSFDGSKGSNLKPAKNSFVINKDNIVLIKENGDELIDYKISKSKFIRTKNGEEYESFKTVNKDMILEYRISKEKNYILIVYEDVAVYYGGCKFINL